MFSEKRKNDEVRSGFNVLSCGIIALIVVGVIACGLVFWGVGIYNTAIGMDNTIEQSWSQVGNVLQRRLDLYLAVEDTLTAATRQESEIFEQLSAQSAVLRQYVGEAPNSEQEVSALNNALAAFDNALVQLNSASFVADNPEIQSLSLFQDFMVQIEGSENRISVERQRYNAEVTTGRNFCRTFPNLLMCGILNVGNDWVLFTPSAEAEERPDLNFGQE